MSRATIDRDATLREKNEAAKERLSGVRHGDHVVAVESAYGHGIAEGKRYKVFSVGVSDGWVCGDGGGRPFNPLCVSVYVADKRDSFGGVVTVPAYHLDIDGD